MDRYAGDSLYPPLSLFLDKWSFEKLPAIHGKIAWSMFQAHIHRCSPCHSAPLRVFREQTESRGALGPAAAQAFTSSRACTKPPRSGWGVERTHRRNGACLGILHPLLVASGAGIWIQTIMFNSYQYIMNSSKHFFKPIFMLAPMAFCGSYLQYFRYELHVSAF